jgi:hypothetical protein
MRGFKCVVSVMLLALSPLVAEEAVQTDWSGGGGEPGPVADWGDCFDSSQDVSWSYWPGELRLALEPLENPQAHLVHIYPSAKSIHAADVDGDGDLDILGAAHYDHSTAVIWCENLDGSGSTWDVHTVAPNFFGGYSVCSADIDGDDDADVAAAAYFLGDIAWFENMDGVGGAWLQRTLDAEFTWASYVHVADVDSDDDYDVLGTSKYLDDVVWWENLDGEGTSWSRHVVDGDFDGAVCVYAADVDSDDDLDVLGAADGADDITWWENTDGSGGSWTEHTVDGDFDMAETVHAADMDSDGDLDVLGACWGADDITWWENTDGAGTSWTEHTVDGEFDGAWSVHAADLDADGDNDVLGAAFVADDLTWWENADGAGTSWTEHTLYGDFDNAKAVSAADVDGDGDVDALGAAYDHGLIWFEAAGFVETGELTGSILDTGAEPGWGSIVWDCEVPEDSALTVEVRASDDPGDMGDWHAVASSGDDLGDYLDDYLRYFQYRLTLGSDDFRASPLFREITVEWTDASGVALVSLAAGSVDEGVLVRWRLTGDFPAGMLVLRGADGETPAPIHDGALPGAATRWLDRDAYDASDKGLKPLVYWLEVTEADGSVIRFGPTEAVTVSGAKPELLLYAAYPNPARDTINFVYSLPAEGSVELCVYDLSGRRVAALVDAEQAAGRHEVAWDCAEIPSGVYLYSLETDSGTLTQRLVVSR